jgi:hypothetical protein
MGFQKWTLKLVQGDGRGGRPNPGAKSAHCGFPLSIRLIFHWRCQRFNCFSLEIASYIDSNNSKRTRRVTRYLDVNPFTSPERCWNRRATKSDVTPMYKVPYALLARI